MNASLTDGTIALLKERVKRGKYDHSTTTQATAEMKNIVQKELFLLYKHSQEEKGVK